MNGEIYFECLVTYTIIFAKTAGLTGLEHVAFDGSIFKAANNKFNVFHRSDVRTLIRWITGKKSNWPRVEKITQASEKIHETPRFNQQTKIRLTKHY